MPGFFSFHRMVSTSIIKAAYVIGLMLISIVGLAGIGLGTFALIEQLRGEAVPNLAIIGQPIVAAVAGAVLLVMGNLLWRLLCEGWILLFSMHELLATIAERLDTGSRRE